MAGDEKLFYTIGETAQIVNVKPYVLRYWETEFRRLNPQKSETGQRTYRIRDLQVAMTIKRLLYEEQYTIAGAVKKLEELENEGLDILDLEVLRKPILPDEKDGFLPDDSSDSRTVNHPVPTEPRDVFPLELVFEIKELLISSRNILRKYDL